MELDIKDYLHYYIGCRIKVMEGTYLDLTPERFAAYCNAKHLNDYKLCLRPLSDMKEEEGREYAAYYGIKGDFPVTITEENGLVKISIGNDSHGASLFPMGQYGQKPQTFHYLLSNGFDLFSLIENNLAIDKTKQDGKN